MSGTARITPRLSPPNVGIGQGLGTQGMISSANPFVQPDLTLAPISFRFLFSLIQQVNAQQGQIDSILQRLQAAGIP